MRSGLVNLAFALSALLALDSTIQPAVAIGYWNLPGNFCQCAGYGWGAGHHACFVLGPISCNDCCAHREVRLPYAPQPASACYGYGNGGYDFRQPGMTSPPEYQPAPTAPAPTSPPIAPAPLPIPEEPAPSRPIFDAPVEP